MLRISLKNIWSIYWVEPVLWMAALLILYWFYDFEPTAVKIFIVIAMLDLLPSFALLLDYWLRNRNRSYELFFDRIEITKSGGERSVFKVNEIESITICGSPSVHKKSEFHLLAIEAFHFAKIELSNHDPIYLTCLVTPNIEEAVNVLKGVLIKREVSLFNTT